MPGVFAAPGNHEYLHDIRVTRPIYEQSAIPLLVDRGVTLPVGRARLYIAGADDPIYRGDEASFLDGAVTRAAAGAPADAFRLLLCHRPEGFVPAAARGFHLTLSGHTHGGQCKPPFLPPPLLPVRNRRYTAGQFDLGDGRKLYINRGVGHLLRVRFNVRPEVTVFTLTHA